METTAIYFSSRALICVNCQSLTSCVSLQMLRPRNHNAVYLSTCEAAQVVKDNDLCVITQLEDQEPCAYPDKQVRLLHATVPAEKLHIDQI